MIILYTVIATFTVIASWDLHGPLGRTGLVLAAVAPTLVAAIQSSYQVLRADKDYQNYLQDVKALYAPQELFPTFLCSEPECTICNPRALDADGCTDPKTSSRKANSFLSDFYEFCEENGYSQEERPMVFQEWANED